MWGNRLFKGACYEVGRERFICNGCQTQYGGGFTEEPPLGLSSDLVVRLTWFSGGEIIAGEVVKEGERRVLVPEGATSVWLEPLYRLT